MPLNDQSELETAMPDRFEGAEPWLALADAALSLVWDTKTPSFPPVIAAHEAARLNAKHLSLTGIDDAKKRQAEIAVAVRGSQDPWAINRYAAAWGVLSDAQKAPDQRRTWRQWLEQHDLIPTSSEAAAAASRQVAATRAQPSIYRWG